MAVGTFGEAALRLGDSAAIRRILPSATNPAAPSSDMQPTSVSLVSKACLAALVLLYGITRNEMPAAEEKASQARCDIEPTPGVACVRPPLFCFASSTS